MCDFSIVLTVGNGCYNNGLHFAIGHEFQPDADGCQQWYSTKLVQLNSYCFVSVNAAHARDLVVQRAHLPNMVSVQHLSMLTGNGEDLNLKLLRI